MNGDQILLVPGFFSIVRLMVFVTTVGPHNISWLYNKYFCEIVYKQQPFKFYFFSYSKGVEIINVRTFKNSSKLSLTVF